MLGSFILDFPLYHLYNEKHLPDLPVSEVMTSEYERVRTIFLQHISTWMILNIPLGECMDTKRLCCPKLYFNIEYLNFTKTRD